jgi:hypothetical protein
MACAGAMRFVRSDAAATCRLIYRVAFAPAKATCIGNAERTTWHAQLAFAEAWQGPKVCVWTSAEQALATLTLPAEFLRLTTTCSGSSGAAHARGVVKP